MTNHTKNQAESYADMLVVISEDGTADIAKVVEKDGQRIFAGGDGEYSVPLDHIKSYTGKRGRIFVSSATLECISEYRAIARLERSVVLRQITQYEPAITEPTKIDFMKLVPYFFIFFLIILYAVKK
jgi:precorrin-6B methylase 2